MSAGIPAVHVLLPGITANAWRFGGRLIAETFAGLLDQHVPTRVVTYRDRELGLPFLDDILPEIGPTDLFVVTWGPHVQGLVERLAGRRVVYYAQSTGWKMALPDRVPILCLSRYILAYWMQHALRNPLFLLGPVLEPDCRNLGLERDFDVLFHERKSTSYVREALVPALQERLRVHVVREFVPRAEMFRLYNRSKTYLYSSSPNAEGWVEGFGFQPLEALVCGCAVFSNLHGGLADYLDPEMNAHKLVTWSLAYDVERIERAVREGPPASDVSDLERYYSKAAFHERVGRFLPVLADFFERAESTEPDIQAHTPAPVFPPGRPWPLRAASRVARALRKRKGA